MARFTGALEVSRTAVTRDFQFMRDRLGAPIVYDRHHNGHQYDPSHPRFELPGFWLDASELFALLACEHLIEAVQPGIMTPHIAPLRERITRMLNASGHDASAIRERVCLQPAQMRGTDRHTFAVVAQATLEGKRLRLNYHARGSDTSSQRTVSPQRLCHYRSNWYLAAWCHQANSLRMFSLDRIQNPDMLAESAQAVPPAELEPVLAGSFGIFTGSPTATAHLRFTPRAARWVAEESWHPLTWVHGDRITRLSSPAERRGLIEAPNGRP